MRRLTLIFAAAMAALVASPSLAQSAPADPASQPDDNTGTVQGEVVPESRVIRMEFDGGPQAITTLGSDQLDRWISDIDTTSSRTRGRASSTRVIRACEISLTLDGDCAGR